mgnify:CR=1 FL=1
MKKKRISKKKIVLILLIIGAVALSFVKAPEPLNPDTAVLPEAYEQYHRNEDQTYLTFPEWYIVYSSDEYARFIQDNPPSAFPYFASIDQFWRGYWEVYKITKDKYTFNTGYHVMVGVIGTSLTIEYALKGIYENTIGRISEKLTKYGKTDEDQFAADMQKEYVDFIRVYPWYEFDFAKKLNELWSKTDKSKTNIPRQLERKFILSMEYGGKAVYGWVMKKMTYLSYAPESPFTVVQATHIPDNIMEKEKALKFIKKTNDQEALVAMPRYDAFKNYALMVAKEGGEFTEIAGNKSEILITVIAPKEWNYTEQGEIAFSQNILTEPQKKRLALKVPVASLSSVLLDLEKNGIILEHIYDY